jgi:Fibronectin type III domain
MRSGSPRLVAVLCMIAALGSCNGDRVLSPDTGILFASNAAGTAPSVLTAIAASSVQITLHWTDNSTNEDGFEIHRSVTGESGPFTLRAPAAPNAVSYPDQGLTPEAQYCYEVRAYRKLGKNMVYSGFSNVACATTPPAAPSNVNATPVSSTAVDVAWLDNSTAEDGFRIERSVGSQGPWTLVTTTSANATSYHDVSLTTEQMVCYRVTAFSTSGTSVPSSADCTTPPAAPENLTATSPSDGFIDLAWADRSGAEDGYEVERSGQIGVWGLIALLPANSVGYRDATVSTDVEYSYRVRARKDGGFSDFSAVASAVSAASVPLAPSGVTATPSSSTQIYVTWADNSRNELAFRIERSPDGATGWVTAYTTPSGDGTQWLYDSERPAEERVCYRVFAVNDKGPSEASNVACTTPPAAPTDLLATTASNYAIDLQWTNNSTVADGYAVQRVYSGYYYYYDYYETIATLGPAATSYTDDGHGPGEYYTYRVVALKDGGQSDPSNLASAFTEFPPPAPTGLTATPGAAGRINLAWTYPSAAGDYILVDRCLGDESACDDVSFEQISAIEGTNLLYTDTTVQTGTRYTYRVRAYRRGQSSAPSNKASATAP